MADEIENLPQFLYDLRETFGTFIFQILYEFQIYAEEEEGDDSEDWAFPTIDNILSSFARGIVPDFRNDPIPIEFLNINFPVVVPSEILLFENTGSLDIEMIDLSDSEDDSDLSDSEGDSASAYESESESKEEEKKPVEKENGTDKEDTPQSEETGVKRKTKESAAKVIAKKAKVEEEKEADIK